MGELRRAKMAWRPTVVDRRHGLSGKTTFRVYADQWLVRTRIRLRPRTRDLYQFVVGSYLVRLERVPLRKLTRQMISTRVVDPMLAKGLSVGTVKSALIALSSILSEAVADELVAHNVAFGLARRLGRTRPVRPPTIYEPDQVARFLEVAILKKPALAPLFSLCAGAGLRVGEAQGMRGEDLYLERRQLRIERTIRPGSKVGPTKSGHARVVDLPPSCMRLLTPFAGQPGWCFPSELNPGLPICYSTVRAAMREICAEARIPVGSPHALRHALASNLATKGVPILYIQRALGHRDIKTTMHYADHLPMPRPAALDDL